VPGAVEPVHLRGGVPVDDIALIILERPGDNDQDVALADPDLLLDPPSAPRTRIWLAPIIISARPKISQFFFWGSRTLTISSPVWAGLFSVTVHTLSGNSDSSTPIYALRGYSINDCSDRSRSNSTEKPVMEPDPSRCRVLPEMAAGQFVFYTRGDAG